MIPKASFKSEIWIILGSLALILLLPVFAVAVISQSGFSAVAKALASSDPVTHEVKVRDPKGNVIFKLEAKTTWPVCGIITTNFGDPDLPYQQHHTGIDIADPYGKIGDPVTPFMAGTVIVADNSAAGGWGKHVVLSHGHSLTSLYGHMSRINVTKGKKVKPGDIIGFEGTTGHSTGPHVHFQTKVSGVPVNPRTFVPDEPPGCQ
jgi:murein DD-endopeptidase MepM/ murein hydrolase activator NlpD